VRGGARMDDKPKAPTWAKSSQSGSTIFLIVLNWNNYPDTLACLASLQEMMSPPHRVLIVDNGSSDDSEKIIRSHYPDLDFLQTGRNLGYAGGNNVGIRYALAQGADYVCILNNDVTVEPDFLGHLLSAIQHQPAVGIVTPLIAEKMDAGRVWALGSAVDRRTAIVSRQHAGEPVSSWRQRGSFDVDIASGAAMVAKRDVFERVGLLDESYFLYYEEVDWCLTARKAGYRILCVPSSVVWHQVSAALGTTSPIIDYYMLRNHLRFIGRHWLGARRVYLLAKTVARDLVSIAAFTARSHRGRRIPNRDARLLALRDALLGRWGKMGPDVAAVCSAQRHR